MTLVIKIGGHAAEDTRQRRSLARQIAALQRSGHHVVVVHGGGRLLTQTLARLGIPTEFYRGLRVTGAETRDVALMVLAGIVNKRWVAELECQGQTAMGICGGDASLVVARKLVVHEPNGNGHAHSSNGSNGRRDLGFVGRPCTVNTRILEMAFREAVVPVVASVALSPKGEYLNVNADDFAAAIASAIRADRLIYLTEAGGVWDADQRLLRVVKLSEIRRLIRQGIVRDGMIPKLESCARTLRQKVGEIHIVSPESSDVLLRALEGERVGTRIVSTKEE
jgi:acetylglutamate kinase